MPQDYGRELDEAADRHGVPRERFRAMAHVESRGNPGAVSKRGARGLLQVMPATAVEMGYKPEDMSDPKKAADAGAKYARKMYDRFKDWDTAVEAYNAGPARVARRKREGIALPGETRRHLVRVKAAEAAQALAEKERTQ
jgi:soluble lytic murein transglycosylase-like protein